MGMLHLPSWLFSVARSTVYRAVPRAGAPKPLGCPLDYTVNDASDHSLWVAPLHSEPISVHTVFRNHVTKLLNVELT
jgi:hypothetical protein